LESSFRLPSNNPVAYRSSIDGIGRPCGESEAHCENTEHLSRFFEVGKMRRLKYQYYGTLGPCGTIRRFVFSTLTKRQPGNDETTRKQGDQE
jgi:hypothetical protein